MPRPTRVLLAVCACGWAAIAASAQDRPAVVVRDATAFAGAMARLGEDWMIVDEAIAGPTYLLNSVRGDGLTRLDRMTDLLSGARTFLKERSRTDAATLVETALQAVAALRVELTRAEPDQAAAQEEAAYVREACAACHGRFREGDAATGYRFRPGVLD